MPSASSDSEVQITPPSWYIDSSSGNLRLWLLNSQSLRHSHVWLYLPLGKLCFLRNAIFVRSYTIVAWLKLKSFRRGKKKVCWVLFNNILKPTCAPILYTEKVIGRYDFTFFTVELLSSYWKKTCDLHSSNYYFVNLVPSFWNEGGCKQKRNSRRQWQDAMFNREQRVKAHQIDTCHGWAGQAPASPLLLTHRYSVSGSL